MTDSGSEDEGGASDEFVLAMHDFAPQQPNATCLSFRAGQVIRVLNRDTSGWWDGELDGQRGWFPSNYVTSEVGLLTEEELPDGKASTVISVAAGTFSSAFVPSLVSFRVSIRAENRERATLTGSRCRC